MRRPLGIVAVVVCLAPVAFEARQAPQSPAPPPRFRAGTDILQLDVSVLDAQRKPVRGLTARDFTVTVDGRTRPVVAFTEVSVPARPGVAGPQASWMHEYSSDVVSNTTAGDGRMVVILFNRMPNPEQNNMAAKIARAAIDQLGPADLGAVLSTRGGIRQGFTPDHARLIAAIDQPIGAIGGSVLETAEDAECHCGTCVHQTFERIAEATRDARRRKIILYISTSGVVFEARGECGLFVKAAATKMLAALDRTNTTVYTLDPSGIQTLAATAAIRGIPSQAFVSLMGALEGSRIIDIMRLPERTGGGVMVSNFANLEVPEAFDETTSYYLLGIEPPAPRADGRDASIQVATRNKAFMVNAPRAYAAMAERTIAPAVLEALPSGVPLSLWRGIDAPFPVSDRPLAMTATPIALLPSGKVAVAVLLDAEWPPPEARSSPANALKVPIDVVTGAFDRNGKELSLHVQKLERAQIEDRSDRHFGVLSRLVLAPGNHEVRVGLEEPIGGRGSVYGYVDVPDFATLKLSLSGVLLDSGPGTVSGEAGLFDGLLPFVPTARRTFGRDDFLRAWVRVFQAAKDQLEDVELSVRLVNTKDEVVLDRISRLERDEFDEHATEHTVNLPVADLPAGQYLLTISAARGAERAQRHVRFTMQ